mmetsp:Transcript_14971/g.40150  ORF Transcript_14971/g.40150 Transcript_14971/m.40150 type:complete len:86 (-) Transcript_14971:1315-1572(-)
MHSVSVTFTAHRGTRRERECQLGDYMEENSDMLNSLDAMRSTMFVRDRATRCRADSSGTRWRISFPKPATSKARALSRDSPRERK